MFEPFGRLSASGRKPSESFGMGNDFGDCGGDDCGDDDCGDDFGDGDKVGCFLL